MTFQLTTECEAESDGAVAPEVLGEPQGLEPQGDPAAKAIEQRSYRLQVTPLLTHTRP